MGIGEDQDIFQLLSNSYFRFMKKTLVPEGGDPTTAARWLYEKAPFCLLAQNTAADPCFIYANRAAQTLFEYTWEEFIVLPSRFSAEPPNREERQRLFAAAARDGYITDYSGLRISKSGRRFLISNVTLWQLLDESGKLHGQAAVYGNWGEA